MGRQPESEHDAANSGAPEKTVRLDRWLCAARFFKTRAISADAVGGGKVEVNGERAKSAKPVKAGDSVRVRLGPYVHEVIVRGVSERRGPAREAALLYEETAESRAAREKLHWQLKHAAPVIEAGDGRPTKKNRRDIRRMRGY